MRSLSVVCPVYNEEQIIETFYRELTRVLDSLSQRYRCEIIFAVDRCTDSTLEILREIAAKDPKVKVLSLSSRFGHQMSLLAGIDHSQADAIIMMDSDLQHPPSVIPKLIEEFERGHDIVYTIRKDTTTNPVRRLASTIFYRAVNRVSKFPIQENAADFRLISKRVARIFQTRIRERNQFLRGLVAWVGYKSTGVPFEVQRRPSGRSKYSLARLVHFAVVGVISFSRKPLQAAIYVGLAVATCGFILAIFTVGQYFVQGHLPSGWTTLVILISGFSGIQLIFLGVVGEYIGAIFDEVKARPHYLVDEKLNFPDEQPG